MQEQNDEPAVPRPDIPFDAACVLENIGDAFFALDRQWRFVFLNAQAERLLSRTRGALLGRNIWDEFPEAVGTNSEKEYSRAMGGEATSFEQFYPPLDKWFEARAYPSPDGISVYFHDVTEQAERGRRERFLAALAERARGLTDPGAVIADAVRSLGQFLGASRCVFADIDIEADTCSIPPEYCADETVASIAGTFPISAFGAFVVDEYKAGRTAVVDDVRADPVKAPPETLGAYEAIGVRAYVAAPVMHSARLVSAVAVHNPTPRHWTSEEVELIQAAVERTWLTVQVLRQQHALVREAEERREAHERTANILESITDAFFALDTGFRFTYVNSQAERLLFRTREELLGRVIWDEFPAAVDSSFDLQYRRALSERIAVSFEEFYPPLDTWFEVRAYPSPKGLSVYFHDISRRKASEAARERLAERERNIASQLQAALQPELPGTVSGLAVTKHYEAALTDQAGVGGDFYDVFSVEKGRTALVVGDLSGKGLAAAAAVATVRNMLRAFLYTKPMVAEAVTELNRVLAENNLLTGFTTLFVGAYDSATRQLKYANCGQEPALLRRSTTGAVEQLSSTGPILGSIEGAHFTEETVTLSPGDALAVFSDGITECGPSRTEMLGIEGVTDLFSLPLTDGEVSSATAVAEHLALRLIKGAEAAAGGVIRDDRCLLVGVVSA